MKKFLSILTAFVLVLGAGVSLSACGKKKDNTIKLDAGDYACVVQEDSVQMEAISDSQQSQVMTQLGIDAFDNASILGYATDLLDDTYLTINKDSVEFQYFQVTETEFFRTYLKIKSYNFSNGKLTFKDANGNKFEIKENDKGNLVGTFSYYIDLSDLLSDNFNEIKVFSISIELPKIEVGTDYQIPTAETFYGDRTILLEYKLTEVEGLESYFESFGIGEYVSSEAFAREFVNHCDARLILFTDNTLYYMTSMDMTGLMIALIPQYAAFYTDQAVTEYGYLSTYTTGDNGDYTTGLDALKGGFTITGDTLETTISLAGGIGVGSYELTYKFTKVEQPAI